MKTFGTIMTTAGFVTALALCGCNTGKSKGTVPVEEHHGGMAHQSIYAGKKTSEPAVQATVNVEPASGSHVRGTFVFTAEENGVRIEGSVTGLTPGQHGFHIHQNGDCSSADAKSAGDHFNPTDKPHGGPQSDMHHVGDFGNLTANDSGVATISQIFPDLKLSGPNSIIGRALIVHGGEDDLQTQPSGNSGTRVACGVIESK